MNLRDLMTKLDTIAEADDARAQYDKFKADDARAAAVAQVKTMLKPNGGGNFIDPKDGIVKWQEQMQGDSGGPGSVREFPYDWYTKGQESKFFDMLKTAGLEVVPVERKDPLFGIKSQVVGIKGGPQALTNLDKPQTPAEDPNKPVAGPKGNDDAKKLAELVVQLEKALAGGGGTAPATTTTPATTTPATQTQPGKTLGQKAGIGAGIGAGALAGGALGKKYGGKLGMGLGAVTGGALGGMGVNAFQEGTDLSMAKALTESFGYEFENEQLDEYSWDEFNNDAGDFGRGAWNGVTLGTGDNIAAGVKSAFGPGTYKDELAKQAKASTDAEKRSPWLYGAGNVAGALAMPVPGGALAGGLIKGASTAAKIARGATTLGANLAAQKGIDMVKQKSDLNTLVGPGGNKQIGALQQAIGLVGAQIDGKMGPTTAKALMAWQQENGLPPTGKADPATMKAAGIAEGRITTVAEDIKSIQERLSMIESGANDYQVWLMEDGSVIGHDGVLITDEDILNEIEWNTAINEGVWDAISKGAGKLFKGAQQGWKNPGVRNVVRKGAQGIGAKLGGGAKKGVQWVGKNPGKAAALAGGAGLAGYGAYKALGGGGAAPSTTTTGGGGAGGAGGAGDIPGTTTTPDAGGMTPEIAALVKQIHDLELQHGEDDSPEWIQATQHAQTVLDKAEHASAAQSATDAKNDTGANASNATADTTKGPNMGQVNPPDAAKNPVGTTNAATAIPTGGLENPDNQAKPTVYKDGGGAGAASNPANVKESEDELARWLKIARG